MGAMIRRMLAMSVAMSLAASSAANIEAAPATIQQGTPAAIVCDLSPTDEGDMVGRCAKGGIGYGTLRLREGGDGGAPIWIGTWTDGGIDERVDIKALDYPQGPVLALRTPSGWLPTTLRREGATLRVTLQESPLPPSEEDLRIILRARQLLADESAWDRQDDRVCEPTDTTFSLYCSLHRATIEVTGEFHHRHPALASIRLVVGMAWRDRYSAHRLMNFNNHPDTTLANIQATLAAAERRIREALDRQRE